MRLDGRGGVISTESDGTFLALEKEHQQIGALVQVRIIAVIDRMHSI